MKRFFCFLFYIVFCSFSMLSGNDNLNDNNTFGYIAYSSTNIGDDIQAVAAARFLPKNSVPIDREFISQFNYPVTISTIVNGWFMHTKNVCWQRSDVPPPIKSWPPTSCIDPLLISIYLDNAFWPEVFSEEGVEYLKKHSPVGTRDYQTLRELQKRNIPSYFSGCLTLTLDNPYKDQKRNNVIYAVDVDDECIEFIKAHTKCRVIKIGHGVNPSISLNPELRLKYAKLLLDKYRKAKCIVTARLHAAMPCLAFETPVLLVMGKKYYNGRLDGLRELVHECSKDELLQGLAEFDFNNPPENSKAYLPIRENLIKTTEAWVESHLNNGN